MALVDAYAKLSHSVDLGDCLLQVSCVPTGSKKSVQRPSLPRLDSDELQEHTRKHEEQQQRTVDVQDRETEIGNLPDNASMHDSGSSFKEVGMSKDKLYEAVKGGRMPVPDSINTQPVEE